MSLTKAVPDSVYNLALSVHLFPAIIFSSSPPIALPARSTCMRESDLELPHQRRKVPGSHKLRIGDESQGVFSVLNSGSACALKFSFWRYSPMHVPQSLLYYNRLALPHGSSPDIKVKKVKLSPCLTN
jgi:hypothetical protein